jgi:hypothetical protein
MVIRHEYIESLLCAVILELNPNSVTKKKLLSGRWIFMKLYNH